MHNFWVQSTLNTEHNHNKVLVCAFVVTITNCNLQFGIANTVLDTYEMPDTPEGYLYYQIYCVTYTITPFI